MVQRAVRASGSRRIPEGKPFHISLNKKRFILVFSFKRLIDVTERKGGARGRAGEKTSL
jgi:hypothetical protein